MAYWLTVQDPFLSERTDDNGVWVRPGKEKAADKLAVGDLVFIYEVFKDKETGRSGGASAVILLVEITQRVHFKSGKWVRVARAEPRAEGKCPHDQLLRILDYKRIQSLGPKNSKLKEITPDQYDQIADYFPNYKSEVQSAEESSIDSFVNSNTHSGQRFASKVVRDLVEKYSMDIAISHFRDKHYAVENHSKYKPYDLFCINGTDKYFVEVKGTQGLGNEIFLTNNEVRWAKAHYKNMILFIVHSIDIQQTQAGNKVSGGTIIQINNWKPNDGLHPIAFRYTVPPSV